MNELGVTYLVKERLNINSDDDSADNDDVDSKLIQILVQRNIYNWSLILSGGEKQIISLLRVLVHRPSLVLLDEATSALSATVEQKFYEICCHKNNKNGINDITLISISHNSHRIACFHQYELSLGEFLKSTNFISSDSIANSNLLNTFGYSFKEIL